MEIKQRLKNLKESNIINEQKSVYTSQGISDENGDDSDDENDLPPSTFFVPPLPPFNVPTALSKINKPRLETRQAISAI